jgi:hypothetical protein
MGLLPFSRWRQSGEFNTHRYPRSMHCLTQANGIIGE